MQSFEVLAGITFQQGRIRSGGGTDACWREEETWEAVANLCRIATTNGD